MTTKQITEEEWRSMVITVQDHGIEVTNAPPFAKISLELLNVAKQGFRMHGNMITIGGHDMHWVSYEVIGLCEENRALLVRREDVEGDPPPSLLG